MVSIVAAESDLRFNDSFDQQQVHILLHLHDVGQACIHGSSIILLSENIDMAVGTTSDRQHSGVSGLRDHALASRWPS